MESVHYIAHMIALKLHTDDLVFISREIHSDELPENTAEDITYLVSTCNTNNKDMDINYVDMCGYTFEDENILWENMYEDG